MRKWISLLAAALIVIGQWGGKYLAISPSGREGVMGILNDLDVFFQGGWSPTLVIIGLAILIGIWIASPLARYFVDKYFGEKRREFSAQFGSDEFSANRQRFRWNLERAYRKQHTDAQPGDLAQLITAIEWPPDFPPDDDILKYSRDISWPNEAGQQFWEFYTTLVDPVLDIEERTKILEEPLYSSFLNGRRVSARFWDHWARQMLDGLLSPEDIRAVLESNIADIRALAISELVIARSIGWDRSRGREPLFLLAKQHLDIAGGNWRKVARRWLAGKMRRVAERISANGAR